MRTCFIIVSFLLASHVLRGQGRTHACGILYGPGGVLLADTTLKLSRNDLKVWNLVDTSFVEVTKKNLRNHPVLVEAGKQFKLIFQMEYNKSQSHSYRIYGSSIKLREDEIRQLTKANEKLFTLLTQLLDDVTGNRQGVKFYIPVKLTMNPNIVTDFHYAPSGDSVYVENGWVILRAGIVTTRIKK